MATPDDYLKNEKWVKRLGQSFDDYFDLNKNGILTREEYMSSLIGDMKQKLPAREAHIAKVQKASEDWLDAMGMKAGMKVDKQQFLQLAAAFSAGEAEKLKKGEQTYIERMNYASFEVLDINDNGWLSFDEFAEMMRWGGRNTTDEYIKGAFDFLDKDKNGKLNKKEYAAEHVKFWVVLDDSSSDSLS